MLQPTTTQPETRPPYFSLSAVAEIISKRLGVNLDTWVATQQMKGALVSLLRKYYDGDHPANMTQEMRKLLRAKRPGVEFCDNYMPIIVDTEADRLTIEAIEGDNDAATKWSQETLDGMRFDAMMPDVMEAVLRDGDTAIMTSYDSELGQSVFTHELVWDGRSGVCFVYESADTKKLLAAVKIWHTSVTDEPQGYGVRVNIYYPDHFERYISGNDSGLMPYANPDTGEEAWEDWTNNGTPIGIPLIHFKNRGRWNFGQSEIRDAITLQDALDRTWYSMIMASEMTAFPLYFAVGFPAPDAITPGMVVNAGPGGVDGEQVYDFKKLEGSDLSQYIAQAEFIVGEMARITRTPAPEMMGRADNLSGEALKQKEIGLLGKVRRAQVRFGERFEACMSLAANVQNAFGVKSAPTCKRWRSKWADPEIRNDMITVDNVTKVAALIGDEWAIRALASVFDWDEDTIQRIIDDKKADSQNKIIDIMSKMPAFQNYNPAARGQAGNPKPPLSAGEQSPAQQPTEPQQLKQAA